MTRHLKRDAARMTRLLTRIALMHQYEGAMYYDFACDELSSPTYMIIYFQQRSARAYALAYDCLEELLRIGAN